MIMSRCASSRLEQLLSYGSEWSIEEFLRVGLPRLILVQLVLESLLPLLKRMLSWE